MSSLSSKSVLFFRVYREVTVPLYAGMVEQVCASPDLPMELATTLEDIGQEFIGFAAALNEELLRRGILGDVADADQTVEARIDALVERITASGKALTSRRSLPVGAFLSEASTRQALKAALAMVWDLPSAQRFRSAESVLETANV